MTVREMDENTIIEEILNNKLILAIVAALLGGIVTIFTQRWLNRRALFTYSISHSQIGLSAEDAVYGSVKITWNNNLVYRLYLSTIELTNQSTRDFGSVIVRAFTDNTALLTEKTHVVETTRVLEWTEEYKRKVAVPVGSKPTDIQNNLSWHNREYIIPTMNRGQTIRFESLNAAKSEGQPAIWLDVLHKGVRCKFRPEQDQFAGVSQPTAALVGTLVGLTLVVLILMYVSNPPIAAILSYLIGLLAILPGAFTIKGYQKIRNWFVG